MVPIVGVALNEIKLFSRLLATIPLWASMILTNLIFLTPSYICLLLLRLPNSDRIRAFLVFTGLLILYVPALWIYGLTVSCFLFNRCL